LQKDIAVENLKLSSRNIALIATFAALYYVLSLITPYIPAIGISEMKIRLEALMASVFGLILGPFLGALAALLGVFVTWVLPPVGMSPFDAPFLLSPPINAMIVGSIFYRKWKLAFSLLSFTYHSLSTFASFSAPSTVLLCNSSSRLGIKLLLFYSSFQ